MTNLNMNQPIVDSCTKSLVKVVRWCAPIQTNCITCQILEHRVKSKNSNKIQLLEQWKLKGKWNGTRKLFREVFNSPNISHRLLWQLHSQQEWFPQDDFLLSAISVNILEDLTIGLILHGPFCTQILAINIKIK